MALLEDAALQQCSRCWSPVLRVAQMAHVSVVLEAVLRVA